MRAVPLAIAAKRTEENELSTMKYFPTTQLTRREMEIEVEKKEARKNSMGWWGRLPGRFYAVIFAGRAAESPSTESEEADGAIWQPTLITKIPKYQVIYLVVLYEPIGEGLTEDFRTAICGVLRQYRSIPLLHTYSTRKTGTRPNR